MTGLSPFRIVLGSALTAIGSAFAMVLGAPPAAAAMSAAAGIAAVALLGIRPSVPAPSAAPPVDPAPKKPSVRDFVEAFGEPVLIVRDRRVALANEAARRVLGAGIEGEDVRLAIRHPIAAERLIDPQTAQEDGSPAELVGLGEAERRWTMTIARLADGARLVRLEDKSSMHATERMRTDFVANASHELRTPLATLLGFIETLEELNEADDLDIRQRFLGIMNGEAKRMQRLVDDLISLSRIEAERFSVPRESHDLLTLVEQARDEQRHLSEERGCPVVIEAPDTLPSVAGDRPQLLQMIDNLLANALKYGRRGAPVVVTVGEEDGGMLRVSVADQGEGIAREHLPRITERFYRVDPSRSRAAGGTGLGLSIVKHVVERHRGQLSFDSEVGRGTIVNVLLPAGQAAPATRPPSSKGHEDVTQSASKSISAASTGR